MDLQQLAMTTFVLLQVQWSVEKSAQLIEQLQPTHVIVHQRSPQDIYYLLTVRDALALLTQATKDSSVGEVLYACQQLATPALESTIVANNIPDQCIVLDHGHLIGFFDANVPPQSVHRGEATQQQESRSLVVEVPEAVQLNTVFSLLVSLSGIPLSKASTARPLDALPLKAVVDIVVRLQGELVFAEGNGEGQMIVSQDEETLQFKLQGTAIGSSQIQVLAFHRGQLLGRLKVAVAVLSSSETPRTQYQGREQPLGLINSNHPDLALIIQEQLMAGEPVFRFYLTAEDPALKLNIKSFGPMSLKRDPFQFFQEFFKDIETLPLQSHRAETLAERLAAKGSYLFSQLPSDLRELLWQVRSRIQSVIIQSDEQWIPWELCKLCGREDGREIEGPFFCEAFALTRWFSGIGLKPRLTLHDIALVVPANSGLPSAHHEQEYIQSLQSSTRRIHLIPATFVGLRAALATGQYDGWHFSGHGRFHSSNPDLSEAILEDEVHLTPEDISGKACNLGQAQPLVFLNACQTGRSAMSLTAIGGWARQFLLAGAGAFIGTYYSVYDKPAVEFTRTFYDQLLAGVPIGKAAQEARKAIRSDIDPTWLAYTVFADPLATIKER